MGQGNAEAAQRQVDKCDALIDDEETAQLELLEAQDELEAARDGVEETRSRARRELDGLEVSVPAEVQEIRTRLAAIQQARVLRRPLDHIRDLGRRLDELEARAGRASRSQLTRSQDQLAKLSGRLETLSPLAVLARGYSLTEQTETGQLVQRHRKGLDEGLQLPRQPVDHQTDLSSLDFGDNQVNGCCSLLGEMQQFIKGIERDHLFLERVDFLAARELDFILVDIKGPENAGDRNAQGFAVTLNQEDLDDGNR